LYLYYVPTFMLWSEEVKYARTEPGLWLWFAAECLDSVERNILYISYLNKNYNDNILTFYICVCV